MSAEAKPRTRRLVRVLIVDDSAFVRRTLRSLLLSSGEIDVVGSAADGKEALRLVDELSPDVITLDLEMPDLDGFTFLRILMRRRPLPVIVVSSFSERQTVLRALELGALDFVAKPERAASPNLKLIRGELVDKVMAGAGSLVEQLQRRLEQTREPTATTGSAAADSTAASPQHAPTERRPARPASGVVVVGTSTGGPSTVRRILSQMDPAFPYGIVVAQHMPPRFTRAFAERLNRELPQRVREAESGMLLRCGEVLIAPGGQHLELAPADHGYVTVLRPSQPADRYVPSVDRLLSSAAELAGSRTIGLILTGMGSDGAMGVQYVKLHGGRVLAESEETAVVFGMPRAAIATGAVHEILTVDGVASRLHELAGGRTPAAAAAHDPADGG